MCVGDKIGGSLSRGWLYVFVCVKLRPFTLYVLGGFSLRSVQSAEVLCCARSQFSDTWQMKVTLS